MQRRGKKLGGRKREGGKRKLDLGGGREVEEKERKKEKEKRRRERKGRGRGGRAAAFKKAADSIRATIVIHGAPYRETNTTGITGKKIREGVERERD